MKTTKGNPALNIKSLSMRLYLTPDGDEYLKLCEIYNANGKRELSEKIEGALNNWILEMLLDQEPQDY